LNVSWFKVNANFDKDDRVAFVERNRNGGVAIYHYIKLNCIAARCNQDGGIFITEKIPHTAKTLAKQWGCKEITVKNSLELLISAGLLEVIENVLYISDWYITQSTDKLEEIRKNSRLRQQRYRDNQRLAKEQMLQNRNVTVTQRNAVEEDKDKEKEKEKEGDGEGEKIISEFISLFNTTAFPKIKILSSKQKEAVIKAVNEFGFEKLKESLIIASQSEFLNGCNQNGWVASFDWLIKPENIAKVLNGNYDGLYFKPPSCDTESSFISDEFIEAALSRGFE
jgi:phosphopantetheinyl transferase (holo-ACP synthase)